jgi:hypothetical protein
MNVLYKKVYKFDLDRVVPVEIPLSAEQGDFNNYLVQLIEDVIFDERSRKYLFPKDPTAIMGTIESLVNQKNAAAATLDAANRLLRTEVHVQGRIEHLQREVQKGIMIQALVEHDDRKLFLIIKAEHTDFINEHDNRLATGLPIKKKIFKAFCAHIGADSKPTHATVSDYRTVISTYWWKDFLELVEEYTDEQNTERSFDTLDRKIFSRMKKEHPEDHMNLRNATVQYFRSHAEFVMADYLDNIIKPYNPEDETLDIAGLGTQIQKLPEKGKFDSRFQIVPEKLKKRIVTRLRLTPVLDLVIKENINLDNDVTAFMDQGIPYIKIRSEEGYKHFKKEQ